MPLLLGTSWQVPVVWFVVILIHLRKVRPPSLGDLQLCALINWGAIYDSSSEFYTFGYRKVPPGLCMLARKLEGRQLHRFAASQQKARTAFAYLRLLHCVHPFAFQYCALPSGWIWNAHEFSFFPLSSKNSVLRELLNADEGTSGNCCRPEAGSDCHVKI